MSEEKKLYPHNVLEGFGNGCLLDLRVRIARELLASPMFSNVVTSSFKLFHAGELNEHDLFRLPGDVAQFALGVASELMSKAEKEGFVGEIPSDTEIGSELRDQAKRTALYQVVQQVEGGKMAADEQSRLVPGATILNHPKRH